MNKNFTSLSKRALSVEQQTPAPYSFIDDKFPEYIQVQRTQGTIAGNRIIFNAHSWDPNNYLRSRAYIKLTVRATRSELVVATGVLATVASQAEDRLWRKPGMVLMNSMVSQELKINNNSVIQKDPRYWSKYLTTQHCGRTINDRYLSGSGGSYPYWIDTTIANGDSAEGISDPGILESYDRVAKDIANGGTTTDFTFMEFLNIGVFNFMADKTDEIWSKSWYRKMSPLVPYVRQVGLNIDFKDISANTMFFRYGRNTNAAARAIVYRDTEIVSAELVLTWVKPRLAIRSLTPPKIKLQSWFVDNRSFDLINVADGAATIPYIAGTSTVNIQNLGIHQIPTYMMIFATVNKDDPVTYDCRSLYADTDGAGTQEEISLNTNSGETNMLPDASGVSVRINVLGGDDVIDGNYTDLELYRFTTKNSIKDFPWDVNKFTGGSNTDNNTRFSKYPSEFFLILGEEDLNSYYLRKGQTANLANLSITATLQNGDGYGVDKTVANVGDTAGNKQFKLHLCMFYDRYYYQLDNCGNVYTDFDASFL